MARLRSSEDVREAFTGAMGPDLGGVCYVLFNQIAWLHDKWRQYRILYAESSERIAFLNKTAETFFGTIQRVLWSDILLHIARLEDPARMKDGRENLSLRRLEEMITDPELQSKVEKLTRGFGSAASFARNWRNTLLAHYDLDVALKTGARRVEGASRAKVEGALEAMRALLNEVLSHYGEGPVAFDLAGDDPGGADALLQAIRESGGRIGHEQQR